MKRHQRIPLLLCSLWYAASLTAVAQNTTNLKVCRNTRCAFFFFIDYKNRLIFLSCDILRISLIYAFATSK